MGMAAACGCLAGMNDIEQRAWARLTAEMAGGLHQYDHWEEVPEKMRRYYVDRDLLERAARAAGLTSVIVYDEGDGAGVYCKTGKHTYWRPLQDEGDRYRLAKHLGISIDFQDCCAWKRRTDHSLIQEFWGGECGDEAHAILRAAAELAPETPPCA